MCDVSKYKEYLGRLDDYLDRVNSSVEGSMLYERELYAAFGTHNNLVVENIRDWYLRAEELHITTGDPDDWVRAQHEHHLNEETVWEMVHEAVDLELIFECGGYWFTTE